MKYVYLIGEEKWEKEYPGAKVVCVPVSDWNRELSPWPMKGLRRSEPFTGEGKQTIRRLREEVIPQEEAEECEKRYAAGYSLAGLFSLWALLETDLFDGCASVSGSLWFAGMEEYVRTHDPKRPCSVYLSLGEREKESRTAVLRSVEERTTAIDRDLREKENVRRILLEKNPGGHFQEMEKRIGKGLAWLLEE